MRSTCLAIVYNLLNEVGSLFRYFEVIRVRYRRKKSSRSLSHLLMSSCTFLNSIWRSYWTDVHQMFRQCSHAGRRR